MSSPGSKRPVLSAKRRSAEYVREWEADERLSLKVSKRRGRLFSASKVAGAHSRRDHDQDAEIFQAVVGSLRLGNAVCFGRGRQSVVTKGSSFFPELADEGEDERGRQRHTIWTPDWTHTGDRLKMLSFTQVMAVDGAMAFTANLSRTVVERGLVSSRGFVGYLTDRIVRELKHAELDYSSWAFVIEASPLHDPHLHGVVGKADKGVLRAALCRAGGFSGTLSGREVDVRPITNLEGWIDYVTKGPLLSRKSLDGASKAVSGANYTGGVLGASRGVRAAGSRWYREKRATSAPIS
jgi:hypothetical protein